MREISVSRNAIEPRHGCSSPNTAFMRVDLPAPFGPITDTISPASMRADTSVSTSMSP